MKSKNTSSRLTNDINNRTKSEENITLSLNELSFSSEDIKENLNSEIEEILNFTYDSCFDRSPKEENIFKFQKHVKFIS